MSHLPLNCRICGKHTTTAGPCEDCMGIKMKFHEWFDPDNDIHMKIVEYLFDHGNWPFNTEIESLDQKDRTFMDIFTKCYFSKKIS